MGKKINLFDLLCLFGVLSLLFTVGFHVGLGKRETKTESVLISLGLQKEKLLDPEARVMIDGKYECDIIACADGTLTVECSGEYREPGFLLSGAKYLSKNQPLEIVGGGNYFYGRILEITKQQRDAEINFAAFNTYFVNLNSCQNALFFHYKYL